MKKRYTSLNKTLKKYGVLSKTQIRKRKAVDGDLSLREIETIKRIESGKGKFGKTYDNPGNLIEDLHNAAEKRKNR